MQKHTHTKAEDVEAPRQPCCHQFRKSFSLLVIDASTAGAQVEYKSRLDEHIDVAAASYF